MATAVSIAIRKSEAQARIQKASVKLAKAHGMEGVDLAPHAKDTDIQAALTLEAVADFLEQLAKPVEVPEPEPVKVVFEPEPPPAKSRTARQVY